MGSFEMKGAAPSRGASARELVERRTRIVRVLLGSLVALGMVAYVPSVWLSIRAGLWNVVIMNTVVYAVAVAAFLWPRAGYGVQGWVLVGTGYALGVFHLVLLGPVSAAPLWLASTPVLAAILFDRRETIAALAITTLTIAATGALLAIGFLHWEPAPSDLGLFAVISGSLLLIAAGLALAVNALIEGLRGSAERAERLALEVAEGNRRLLREMADREAAESRLRQTEKLTALGTLAGGIAHNLNNLLTPLLMGVEMLRDGEEDPEEREDLIERMQSAAVGARDVVRQVLSFSRAGPEGREAVDSARAFGDAVRLLRTSLPANVELRVELDPAAGPIPISAADAHQIVLNLGSNALHAMPEGGRLSLTLGLCRGGAPNLLPDAEYVCLTVHDTGVGMDETTLGRAVEPFFTTKAVGRGTGLGLASIHGIVSAAGGALRLESEPGSGTTVRAYLPRAEPPAPRPDEPRGAASVGERHVLVVDDDPGVRAVAVSLLQRMRCRVSAVASAEEALGWLDAGGPPIDLLLTDLNMPGASGLTLVEGVRRARPGVPVVLMSGFLDGGSQARASELGVAGIVAKPFRITELQAAIAEALEG